MTATGKPNPIGFVGLGNMGQPMSLNLARAGWPVAGYDAEPARMSELAAQHENITAMSDLQQVADMAQVVVLMLPDSDVVDPVAAALATHLKRNSLIIDMSSSFPQRTQALGQRLVDNGIRLVDAPVSGGVKRAISGSLSIMAGGNDGDIAEVEPLFAPLGTVFRTGPLGSGHATKALNNFLSASSLIATAEALCVGEAFGLSGEAMNAVFDNSTGKSNTTSNKVTQFLLPGRYESGFTLALLEKDVGMAREMARALGLPAETLGHVSEQLRKSKAELADDADHTAVHAWLKAINKPA